jgi:hypothetical protein
VAAARQRPSQRLHLLQLLLVAVRQQRLLLRHVLRGSVLLCDACVCEPASQPAQPRPTPGASACRLLLLAAQGMRCGCMQAS